MCLPLGTAVRSCACHTVSGGRTWCPTAELEELCDSATGAVNKRWWWPGSVAGAGAGAGLSLQLWGQYMGISAARAVLPF